MRGLMFSLGARSMEELLIWLSKVKILKLLKCYWGRVRSRPAILILLTVWFKYLKKIPKKMHDS